MASQPGTGDESARGGEKNKTRKGRKNRGESVRKEQKSQEAKRQRGEQAIILQQAIQSVEADDIF